MFICVKISALLSTIKPLVQIGKPFIEILTVDSTNNYAHQLITNNEAQNGTVVFAHHQTNGKGQMGKQWSSAANNNITLSAIVDVSSVSLHSPFWLIAATALGCYHFFTKYAVQNTAIKWSNDIYWNDKKAGGILIETLQHNGKRWAILGIGINVNQTIFDNNLPNAVSLQQITGKSYNVLQLANELCKSISIYINILLHNQYQFLAEEYNRVLYKKDEEVILKKGNIKFTCIIKSVNSNGELVVANGLQETFSFGEVSWIL